MKFVVGSILLLCLHALADEYRGNLSTNRNNSNSTSNPQGQYGSPTPSNSINNPNGEGLRIIEED